MELYNIKNISIKVNGCEIIKSGSFTINSDETVVIYSPYIESSLLIEALFKLREVDSGEIDYVSQNLKTFNREDVSEWRINDVQFIDSRDTLFSNMSVSDNIWLPVVLNRKQEDEDYFYNLIDLMQIRNLLNKDIKDLTAFEITKVKIARSLILRPFVLLLKNPTETMSEEQRIDFLGMINQINDRFNTTIVHSTTFSDIEIWASKKIRIIDGIISELKDV